MWKVAFVAVILFGSPWIVALVAKYSIAGICAIVLGAMTIVYLLEERC